MKIGELGIGWALFLIFLVLRLCHVINWSWWWITAPVWAPALAMGGFLALAFVLTAIAALIDAWPPKRKPRPAPKKRW